MSAPVPMRVTALAVLAISACDCDETSDASSAETAAGAPETAEAEAAEPAWEAPNDYGSCPNPAPLYALAYTGLRDHPVLALPDTTFPEDCYPACLRAGAARLKLEADALDECAADGVCTPEWAPRLMHVSPVEDGNCAFGVVRAELGYETDFGIYIWLATRHLSIEVDPENPSGLRLREAELSSEHADFRIGPTVIDLDGDGHADWLNVREVASEACFGFTHSTNECMGYGIPGSRVVQARGERGTLMDALPESGAVLTPALSAALDRVESVLGDCVPSLDECPEVEFDLTWRGRRTLGAPAARRIEGGFAIDQLVEEVDCDELCVTPMGDVCTERPSEQYGVSSRHCRSLGTVLESHLVRGGEVERETRPLPDGVVARLRCGDGCSLDAIRDAIGDGDPTLHRVGIDWPDSAGRSIVWHRARKMASSRSPRACS